MKLRCKLGLHKFEVVEEYFTTGRRRVFGIDRGEVPIMVEIIKCEYCPKEKAYYIDDNGDRYEKSIKLVRHLRKLEE